MSHQNLGQRFSINPSFCNNQLLSIVYFIKEVCPYFVHVKELFADLYMYPGASWFPRIVSLFLYFLSNKTKVWHLITRYNKIQHTSFRIQAPGVVAGLYLYQHYYVYQDRIHLVLVLTARMPTNITLQLSAISLQHNIFLYCILYLLL